MNLPAGPGSHGAAGANWPDVRELDARCSRLAEAVPSFSYGGCQFSFIAFRADRSPPGTVIKPHRHSYCEIILILAGEARETLTPGQRLRPGTMQVHGAGTAHAWTAARQGLLRLGLSLTLQPQVAVHVPDVWPTTPDMGDAVHSLLAETVSSAPGRHERLVARLTLLLSPALGLFALPERPPSLAPVAGPTPRDIATFVERFLADNLAEPLALEDVAAQLNVSVPTLTRRFRHETGASVMARLQDLRLQRAADLLRAGELSVKQIGAAVGIPEPSYFCRCFRHAFGCSPTRFASTPS